MSDKSKKLKEALLRYSLMSGSSMASNSFASLDLEQDQNESTEKAEEIELEKGFTVTKNGTTLNVELGQEVTTANAPALTEELSAYRGQDIQKVVFDATRLLIFSSSGIRVLFYVNEKIGHHPEIVFVNCAEEIYESIDYVGLTKSITFIENENKHAYRPKKTLENYAANNDVVCYQMKLGEEE